MFHKRRLNSKILLIVLLSTICGTFYYLYGRPEPIEFQNNLYKLWVEGHSFQFVYVAVVFLMRLLLLFARWASFFFRVNFNRSRWLRWRRDFFADAHKFFSFFQRSHRRWHFIERESISMCSTKSATEFQGNDGVSERWATNSMRWRWAMGLLWTRCICEFSEIVEILYRRTSFFIYDEFCVCYRNHGNVRFDMKCLIDWVQ